MCWTEIKDESSIKELMTAFMGFHDSCIVSISYGSGAYVNKEKAMGCGDKDEHTISMIFHSQWAKPLELFFSGVRKCVINGFSEYYFCDIFGASLQFRTDLLGKTRDDRLIVWADYESFDPLLHSEKYPLDNGHEVTYIIAEKLKYRFLDGGGGI